MNLTEKQKYALFYLGLCFLLLALSLISIYHKVGDVIFAYVILGASITGIFATIILYFSTGIVEIPRSGFTKPDLYRLAFIGKYSIPKKPLKDICEEIIKNLNPNGRILFFYNPLPKGTEFHLNIKRFSKAKSFDENEIYTNGLKRIRSGFPISLKFFIVEEDADTFTIESVCYPAMYRKIAQDIEWEFLDHHIEDAENQCRDFTRKIFLGILGGKEIEEPSSRSKISKSEIKNRLLFRGRTDIASKLDDAERDLNEDRYPDAIGNMRTALSLAIEFYMKTKNLKPTRQVKNNLQRLVKHGYLTEEQLNLIYNYMFSPMSDIFKGRRETTKYEAKLLMNLLMAIIEFILDRS